MKRKLINIVKYILLILVLIIIYMLLLVLTNKIPSGMLEDNIKESAQILEKEGERKEVNLGYKKDYVFNFSDALMLNMAYSVDSNKPVDSMLLSRKDYIPNVTKIENTKATINIGTDPRYINKETGDVLHTKELNNFINNKDVEESYEYARYWHGYMIFLRPLLTIFNLIQIRTLFTILLVGLSLILIYLLYKKINLISAFSFAIGLFSCSVFIVGQSISEIPVFVVTLIISIILLLKKDINKNLELLFLITGSLISFMDLLTEPLIGVLIPITVYFLVVQKQEKMNWKDAIKKYIWLCFIWVIGYVATWMLKWVILDIAKNRGIFTQALEQVLVRSSSKKIMYKWVLEKIYQFFSTSSLYIILIPMIVMIIIGIIKERNKKSKVQICLLPFSINLLAPFVWYFVIKNHSYIHPFFAYKLLFISITNAFIIIANIFNLYKTEKK